MHNLSHETPQVDEITVLLDNLKQIKEQNGYSTAIWDDDRLNRAAQGMMEYRKLLEALPTETASKFTENAGIQACFLGTSPVQDFDFQLNDIEVKQIKQALESRGEKFLLVSYQPPSPFRSKNYVLINSVTAIEIMQNNSDLFQGITDPTAFLKTQPKSYLTPALETPVVIHHQRYGVLSGYPRDSVDLWSRSDTGLGPDRFINWSKAFVAGDKKEGFYFVGFNEKDKQWANEAIALRKATKIGEVHTWGAAVL